MRLDDDVRPCRRLFRGPDIAFGTRLPVPLSKALRLHASVMQRSLADEIACALFDYLTRRCVVWHGAPPPTTDAPELHAAAIAEVSRLLQEIAPELHAVFGPNVWPPDLGPAFAFDHHARNGRS